MPIYSPDEEVCMVLDRGVSVVNSSGGKDLLWDYFPRDRDLGLVSQGEGKCKINYRQDHCFEIALLSQSDVVEKDDPRA